jgi:hypothetical protein
MNEDNLRISLPVTKVDVERRTVYGFATLDNLDKQNDIVPLEASVKAFEKFRGNIREQHDPHKAVGKMLHFKPETLFDSDTGKSYQGVFVSAYISRGAQDTWEKVLDGTLSGFSIGGRLKETRNVYDENIDKMVRVVDDYEMVELSLVDTPANPLANVTLVQKVGDVLEGMDIKGDLETIYMCKDDNVVKVSKETDMKCPVCNCEMNDIGFVESNDTEKSGIIKGMVSKHIGNNLVKEAKEMAEHNETDVVEKTDATEEVVEETVVEDAVEKTDDVEQAEEAVADVEKAEESEVIAEAPAEEVAKADEPDAVNELLIKSLESVVSTLTSLTERIEGIEKTVTERMDSVESKVTETTESVEEFGKRVDKVEDTTAFRKSGDLGEVAQEKRITKSDSVWGGMFLAVSDL